jgi:hypothetical protein
MGVNWELRLPFAKSGWVLRKTEPGIIAESDLFLEEHAESQIADRLNEQAWHSSTGCQFNLRMVSRVRLLSRTTVADLTVLFLLLAAAYPVCVGV